MQVVGRLADFGDSSITKAKVGDEIVDIFRLKNGKVVEHWDVVQAITTLESMF